MGKDNIKIVVLVSIAFSTFLVGSYRLNYNIQNKEISDHIYRELSKSSYPECLNKIPKDKVLNKDLKKYIKCVEKIRDQKEKEEKLKKNNIYKKEYIKMRSN